MAASATLEHASPLANGDPGRHIEVPEEELSKEELQALQTYWRAVNYLAGAQIYLQDNFLLEEPLKPEHIKQRLLGHWGTTPGINLIYLHLNRLVRQKDASVMLITGPGHGAPANLANTYLEGSLAARYSDMTLDRAGLGRLIKSFSWPGGFPSHLNPGTPGAIHEGGELGYALATAFGAAMDNPELIVACIVGDGESETGPTATAWHCPKYMNPATDGFVLPFAHINRYKISSETIYGSMTDSELAQLFKGYGYDPLIVHGEGDTEEDYFRVHRRMASAIDKAWDMFQSLRSEARKGTIGIRAPWPAILFRSPKGWTGIKEADGHPIEGSYRAHQVPLEDVRENPEHLAKVERWLRSYKPEELWDPQGRPNPVILAQCPVGEKRLGMTPYANGGILRQELRRPDFRDYACPVEKPGQIKQGDMAGMAPFLRDVIHMNQEQADFRIFSPDELTSNRLTAVFEATHRKFEWPWDPSDADMGTSGRVVEMLSEHTCQAWLQGYLLTGRHGLFPCYEAFVSIVDSMMNQYAKFLKQMDETPWRASVSSFNYILSSEGWRQDHNGYSHQGPGFINNLLNKKARNVRIYLPPDTNCLLSTIDHCLTSLDKINLVIASKQPMPQWLDMQTAIEHCRAGASIWKWASTDNGENPDIVLAGAGVYPMAEVMGAADLLLHELPEMRIRVVNVTDLLILERHTFHPHGLTEESFCNLFTEDKPVLFNFHGYPSAVKQLIFDRPERQRWTVNGYQEEGTTTTPFYLLMQNGVDRYHLILQAIQMVAPGNKEVAAKADRIIARYNQKLADTAKYVEEHGADTAEIVDWVWGSGLGAMRL